LSQSFDIVKDQADVGVLNNTSACSSILSGLFDIFSVNRRDYIFQLFASVYINKHVTWVGDCTNNSLANCYFTDYFNKKSAFYSHDVNVDLSHCLALLSRFDDLECVASCSFVNICTYYMIFGINICTFVRNNINVPEKFLGMCCEPVCTSPVSPRPFCSSANHINECIIYNFVIGRNIAMGGACCVDCQCPHIGLHMCNHFIGSKFTVFFRQF
jgi:hypothetical protein